MPEPKASKQNLAVQGWILAVAIALFLLKMFAWYLTGSVAILTDALESTVNVVAGIVGFYSLWIAAKPSDANHPYGHGKAEFISAGVEGTLIMLAGIYIIAHSITQMRHPAPIRGLDQGIILVGISAVINCVVGVFSIRQGKKNLSAALEASGRHLLSDTYSTAAIIVGLILIRVTGLHIIDGIVAIIVSIVIMIIGYRIARKSVAGIMDEADEKLLEQIVLLLDKNRQPNWVDIHNFRVIKFGSILHVDCHMTVPWYFNIREGHHEIDILRTLIQDSFGGTVEFFVHADDCLPASCPVCIKTDCQVRQHPFQKQIGWNLGNIVPNKKHDLSTAS